MACINYGEPTEEELEMWEAMKSAPSALDVQEGGKHYKDMAIQPAEFITRNKIGFLEGCVIKRMCRWQAKDGFQDLRKAIHEIQLLMELSNERETRERVHQCDSFEAAHRTTLREDVQSVQQRDAGRVVQREQGRPVG
jgi:hypothetical protein